MSQVRMPQKAWTDILDSVRQKSGIHQPMTAGDLPTVINGMGQFVASFYGEDSRDLHIEIPFKPDVLCVYSTDPYVFSSNDIFRGFIVDMRTAGGYSSLTSYRNAVGEEKTSMIGVKNSQNIFTYSDGAFHFVLPANLEPTVIWRSNVRYTVWAAHLPQEDVKELIIRQIENLPTQESGTVTYYSEIINEHFTEQEWEALISSRPGWTIALS